MFIVAEAGVFCVCEHRQIWSIRSIRDASVGIPWIGSGAAGKAAFILVTEVSAVADMVMKPGQGGGGYYIQRELSRDLIERDTAINVL
jgi:hypothetical protein